jgi:hypothetical protein
VFGVSTTGFKVSAAAESLTAVFVDDLQEKIRAAPARSVVPKRILAFFFVL